MLANSAVKQKTRSLRSGFSANELVVALQAVFEDESILFDQEFGRDIFFAKLHGNGHLAV